MRSQIKEHNHRRSNAESYRKLIHKDKIKVGGTTKAPDYGLPCLVKESSL